MTDRCACGNSIARPRHRRKSDLCKSCAIKALCRTPEHRAKLSAAQRKRWSRADRDAHRGKIREGIRRAFQDPVKLQAAQERCGAVGRSNAGRTLPLSLVKRRADSISASRLSWCPEQWRNDYRHLLYGRNFRASEARAAIERRIAAGDLPQFMGPRIFKLRKPMGPVPGWCPPKYQARLFELLEEHSPAAARRLLTDEIIEAGDSLDLQLHRLSRGASLEKGGPVVRAAADRTYGGVAAYG